MRSANATRLAALVIAVLLTNCGDGVRGGDDAGRPDVAPVETRFVFWERLATTVCARRFQCCTGGAVGVDWTCPATLARQLRDDLVFERGWIRFDGQQAIGCAATFEADVAATPCHQEIVRLSNVTACADTFVGQQGEGEPCGVLSEEGVPRSFIACTKGLTCSNHFGTPICVSALADGSACKPGDSCAEASFCKLGIDASYCTPKIPIGAPCEVVDECVDGAFCEDGVCTSYGSGEVCEWL